MWGVSGKEGAVQDETERKKCSRLAQETGEEKKDRLIGGWQRRGKEEEPACPGLGQPC